MYEKLNSFSQYEKAIEENEENKEIRARFLDFLVDSLIQNKDIEKQKYKNKIIELIEKSPEANNYFHKSYLAFLNNNRKKTISFIKEYISNTKNEIDSSMFFYLFPYPFGKAYDGFYNAVAESIKKIDSDSPAVKVAYGYSNLYKKDYDKALNYFGQALNIDDDYWLASLKMGDIYHDEEMWRSTIKSYNRALNYSTPKNYFDVYFKLGWAYGKIKDYKNEEKAYRKCLELNDNYKNAWNNLGYSLYKQRKYEEALKIFNKSLEKAIDGKYPVHNKVKTLRRLNRYEEALEFIKKCKNEGLLTKNYTKNVEEIKEKLNKIEKNKEVFDEPEEIDDLESVEKPELENKSNINKQMSVSSEKILEDLIEDKILKGQKVFDKKLKIYEDEINYGRQLVAGNYGRIDLLAKESDEDNLIIIELKKGKSDDAVVGQISRYISWVKNNLAKNNQDVNGIICVYESSEVLDMSVDNIPNIEVYEYGLEFNKY